LSEGAEVIVLADLLMRANWAERILFLADRTALARQATRAFVAHLSSAPHEPAG